MIYWLIIYIVFVSNKFLYFKARKLRKFTEHEKRCWSVCFARTENYICATGSNDCSVKVWNLNMANSVMTIKPHFVVCTVNFGFSRNELAVGSADRSIYVYDLRQPVRPTNIFVGHRQAVSYVRYLNSNELVSASTDNHLRLWDTQSATCTRILHGHLNTKNFVGLSSCGDHIITGSEDNRAYLYYKGADRPILIYDVESCSGFINGDEPSPCEPDNESEVFVSAVAWRPIFFNHTLRFLALCRTPMWQSLVTILEKFIFSNSIEVFQ
ncbi:WD domain, G-beta repeat protein [Dictyocaulus viviparus]|uniref:WD domain, G-beta repeat protein n=1 Tax=Dictyocaulus viviparus TaxID=29172 RepID=A0A0D8XDL8_DICVI|nr:WD domain, G-beta repeat protein [Dictyocaulus viviparus]